jgi:hypothetical protein
MLALEVQLAVGVGEQKKPAINSVQEAAARTVAAAAVVEEDFDVSRWLGEDDNAPVSPPRKETSIGADTMAGKSMLDTATIPIPSPQKKEEEEKKKKEPQPPAKTVGKLLRPAKPTTDSSGAAADDALRHFFHRKKP